MKKIFLLTAFFVFVAAHAQPPTRFYTAFGGEGDDIGYGVKTAPDKNYIIVGSSSSYGTHGNTDVYLLKLDTMGGHLFQKFIGGTANDIGKAIALLPDSGFVIAGFTNSFGAGGYDALLLRTDKNGELIWQKTFGGEDWDFASDVILAPDGNIVMVGNTSSFGSGKRDGFIVKYDMGGELMWQKFIGGAENEELRAVIKTSDNFMAAAGFTESRGEINGDGYFVKFDANGDTLFTRTFGGPNLDYASDLVQKSNGDYVLCGAKTFSLGAGSESYMYSITSAGAFAWDNHYKHTGAGVDDGYTSLASSLTHDDYTAYVKPRPFTANKIQDDIFVGTPGGWPYLVNSSGGTGDEFVYSVEGTADGGFMSVGSTTSFNSVGTNVYFIKMDSTIINYSANPIGIPKIKKENRPEIRYFEKSIDIPLTTQTAESASIYDMSGKLLQQYFMKEDALQINTENYPASIYFLKINFKNGYIYSEKFIRE